VDYFSKFGLIFSQFINRKLVKSRRQTDEKKIEVYEKEVVVVKE
jgi:hypothetical protein